MRKATQNFTFEGLGQSSYAQVIPSVTLRNKTRNIFEGNEEIINAVEKTCYEFCQKSFKDARYFLWKMKFYREDALNGLGFTLNPSKEILILLTEKQADRLYNEMRFQYVSTHEDFLKVDEKLWCKEELTALKKAVNDDQVVYFTIVSVCEKSYGSNTLLNNSISLLTDSCNEYSQIKALYNLGFSKDNAALIKPYSNEIANLLKSYIKHFDESNPIKVAGEATESETSDKKVEESEVSMQTEAVPSADEALSKELETDESITCEVQSKEPINRVVNNDVINVDILLKNKNTIRDFINLSKVLSEAGIDSMKVLKKLSVIESLFDAVDNLST